MTAEVTWEKVDAITGYLDDGHEIEIYELDNDALAAKWGRQYRPGRDWVVYDPDNQIIAKGNSKDLREAKRDALAAIKNRRTP